MTRAPYTTRPLDLARLGGAMLAELARRRRHASMRRAVGRWTTRLAALHGTRDIVLKCGPWRLLLVGDAALSRCILHTIPGDGIVAGNVKRKAMSFLAPRALTIADGDAWRRRRTFNEAVLEPGRLHHHATTFVDHTRDAFRQPVHDVATLRSAMRRCMLAIVFGSERGSEQLGTDVEALFALVQSPVRRALLGRFERTRRRRVRESLREQWTTAAEGPSLLADAHAVLARMGSDRPTEEEVLDQIPHWMFTFTGSATDLVARTLALVLSHPAVHATLASEVEGASYDAQAMDDLPYLEACLLEAAQLYPPVTRTFHRTTCEVAAAGTLLPSGLEMLHVFPGLDTSADGSAPRFRPERWVAGRTSVDTSFDPFLGGARHCPGRSLILLVCKVAVRAAMEHGIALRVPRLKPDDLPPALPVQGLRFSTRLARGGSMSAALQAAQLSSRDFIRMSQADLDALFCSSPIGPIPRGQMSGTAIFMPGTIVAPCVRLFARWFCWKGKVFNPDGKELKNRISPFGFRAIRARVSIDTSWLDGSRAILIDYSTTSFVARRVRDEIREVRPGLYLGKVWWGKRRLLDFALEA